MKKQLLTLCMVLLCMGWLCADFYVISGVGRLGDPFVFVDNTITFVTNLTPEVAPEGTVVQLSGLEKRRDVNFAEARLAIELEPDPENIYTVAGTGRKGDPYVYVEDKVTYLTNLSGEEVGIGSLVSIYNLRERENVNFAIGVEYIPPEKEKDNSDSPAETVKE